MVTPVTWLSEDYAVNADFSNSYCRTHVTHVAEDHLPSYCLAAYCSVPIYILCLKKIHVTTSSTIT